MPSKMRRILQSIAFLAAFAAAAPAGAIVGGADDGSGFANQVVMVLTRGEDKAGFCSGVVLGPRVVLTAAHCLRPAQDMAVFFRDDKGAPVLLPVAAAASHPLYHADAVAKRIVSIDLALIELGAPLPDRFAAPRLASGDGPDVGEAAIVAGFGVTREGEPKTGGSLRSAKLQVRAPLSRILLWAGGAEQEGACYGDSGGPLFSSEGTVLAIVAWSAGSHGGRCGTLTQGPLVAPQRAWIDATLVRWGL
ncbi:MAG: trypsin-like serine protease [Hyphomicrobiales bacterium]|nr:trypsin-like serine protease [Hyphomicrobiales bacterium]